jgi:soluble lytic murein transglycosylase-like protein
MKYKFTILSICCAIACRCLADDAMASDSHSLVDFEQQVRDVAIKTATEKQAQKEQARLAKNNRQVNAEPSATGQPLKVFRYQKNGAVMYADRVPLRTPYQLIIYNSCYACNVNSNIDWYSTKLHLTEFADNISQASARYNVDAAFIRAVIHAESAFNPLARSRKGAMGLMQLMPSTAKAMGVNNCSDPQQNIQGGVKYLATLLQTFKGNHTLAAAAYNAGPSAVTRHNGIPPFEETQTYVKRVHILMQRYKSQIVLANK